MSKQPYIEYLDFDEEQKEYALLCNGKSEKYIFYTDWESHIIDRLSYIRSGKDLYNFKRYCINRARSSAKSPEMFSAYIPILIGFYLGQLPEDWSIWLLSIAVFGMIVYSIKENKSVVKESYFFQDIIEIIEKIEALERD